MPSPVEWAHCFYTLDEPVVKRIIRGSFNLEYQPDAELSVDLVIKLMVMDWLNGLGFLSDEQQRLVVTAVNSQLEGYAEALRVCLAENLAQPVFTLVITGYRYVACVGHDSFFDVEEAVKVEELPEEADTHIILDASARYSKLTKRMVMLRSNQQRGKEAHESLAARPNAEVSRASTPRTLEDFVDGKPSSDR